IELAIGRDPIHRTRMATTRKSWRGAPIAPVRARRAGIRDRRSAPGFSSRGHARAMDGIAPNGQLNAADAFLQNALYQSKVGFFHFALLERFPELGVCGVVLGDQDDSRSLFI